MWKKSRRLGSFENLFLIFIALTVAPFWLSALYAAAGDLDPTFGVNGTVTTDFSGEVDSAGAMGIQSDGKIVLAGSSGDGANRTFAVARYNSDGTLDSSFSGDGKTTTDFLSIAHGLVIQNDGKIVVAGYSFNGTDIDFALVRYKSDGALDTTFSQDGLVTTNINVEDEANAVALDASGKILVAGSTFDGISIFTRDFALARYNSDGTLDMTFSEDGVVTTNFQGEVDAARALAIQADGKILVAGVSDGDLALARYNADGSLDGTFAENGKTTTNIMGTYSDIRSIAIQNDGKIVAAGNRYKWAGENEFFFLARYNHNGTLDTDFAQDGIYTDTLWSRWREYAFGVALQEDGKILAAGWAGLPYDAWNSRANFAVARFNEDGRLDAAFSGDGRVNTLINNFSTAATVGVQTDGKIIVAGASNGDFAIARYLAEGSPCSGTAMFCDDFEDGVVEPGWTTHSPSWSESGGFLIGSPSSQKAEIVAGPIFADARCVHWKLV